MNKSKSFLEFVRDNLPPCLPGDKLYWFDDETGEIKQDERPVGKIVLDEKWEWKIIDSDNGELVTPNETPYMCITAYDAKRFRDQVASVKYAFFRPDQKGSVVIDGENYSYYKDGVLRQIDELSVSEDYFSAILKINQNIKVGTVVVFKTNNSYVLAEDGIFEECLIKFMDKKTKRILEDIFE